MTHENELPAGAFGLRSGHGAFPSEGLTAAVQQATGVYLDHPNARPPAYHHEGDMGHDVYAVEDTFVPFLEPVVIKTGLCFAFPEGVGAFLTDRSSTFMKGLIVGLGKIDNRYSKEVGIMAFSITGHEFDHGQEDERGNRYGFRRGQWVKAGDRVAQLVFVNVHPWHPLLLSERPESIRGGYGSTGAR